MPPKALATTLSTVATALGNRDTNIQSDLDIVTIN
jgi:hypothetical protein